MRTTTAAITAALGLILTGCSSSGTDYSLWRQVYVAQATYGDPLVEPPVELTDTQIDTVITEVCPDPDGPADWDAADDASRRIDAPGYRGALLADALLIASRAVGACDPLPDTYDPVARTDTRHPNQVGVYPESEHDN